jgi:3-deoxy-D-manno-octulosonic-acid transferase
MSFCLKKRLLLDISVDTLPDSPLWVHCASVGEFNTFKPILKELKKKHSVVLTYFSPRAKEYMEKNSDLYDAILPLPLDIPFLIRKFEKILKPKALIVVERELWPFLLKVTRVKKILINAYARGGFLEKFLIKEFSLIIARSEGDKALFEREGARKVVSCGNLKLVQEEIVKPAELDTENNFRLFVAGSTREGEEEIVLDAFLKLREKYPLKLVIAPRHMDRVGEVERLLGERRISFTKRSSMKEKWDVLILDTLGELKAFYSIADVTFVGGTFSPVGGHNILEPAYLGKPVLFGPNTQKVRDLEEIIISKGYGFKVGSAEELSRKLEEILEKGFRPSEDLKDYARKVKECYLKHLSAELEQFS